MVIRRPARHAWVNVTHLACSAICLATYFVKPAAAPVGANARTVTGKMPVAASVAAAQARSHANFAAQWVEETAHAATVLEKWTVILAWEMERPRRLARLAH